MKITNTTSNDIDSNQYVCVCVCACVCVCMYTCVCDRACAMHVCTCVWGGGTRLNLTKRA